jgi:hypothetical protein
MQTPHLLTISRGGVSVKRHFILFSGVVMDQGADVKVQKVKRALLGMQRAAWEQGVAAQAFLELGDTQQVVLMAHDAALYGGKALTALKQWQMEQPNGYKTVFVNLRKGGTFTGDTAMSTTAVWKVVVDLLTLVL